MKYQYQKLAQKVNDVADIVDRELEGSIYADELNNIADKIRNIPDFIKRAESVKETKKKK